MTALIWGEIQRRIKDGLGILLPWISPQIKTFISGVQDEACGPLEMAVSSAWGNHGGPV